MRNLGVQSGGSIHWFMQRVTGITLVVLLAIHTIVSHYRLPAEGLTYEWVSQRLAYPTWKLIYLFFLALCVYHGSRAYGSLPRTMSSATVSGWPCWVL